MNVLFTHPIRPSVQAYRGDYDHGVEGEPTRYIVADPEPVSIGAPAPVAGKRIVTHTYQVPLNQDTPTRILPQDPDRVRALLAISGQVVYVTSLHGGPQADYGFPLVPGQEPTELTGSNQLYGVTSNGPAIVYVLIEREVEA